MITEQPFLGSVLFFAKRMQLPPSLVADVEARLSTEIETEWGRAAWKKATEIQFASEMYVKCESAIVAAHFLFSINMRNIIRHLPDDVWLHCIEVYALLRLRLFKGNKDVCWMVMDRVFMDGDSIEAGVAVINQYPKHVKNLVEAHAVPSVKICWNRYWVEFITTGPTW